MKKLNKTKKKTKIKKHRTKKHKTKKHKTKKQRTKKHKKSNSKIITIKKRKKHFPKLITVRKSNKQRKIKYISNTTPKQDTLISEHISKMLDVKGRLNNREIISKLKSYVPSYDSKIKSLQTGITNIFGCEDNSIEDFLMEDTFIDKFDISNYDIKIKVGINNDGTSICKSWTSKIAKDTLLRNLKYSDTIKCNNIIGPLQRNSNCWFNSFFMNFFISDKGRRFFKRFRQCMILGTTFNNQSISNKKLNKPLFLLNMAIEASYNSGELPQKVALGSLMNTNNIINLIYNSLTSKQRKNNRHLKHSREANNPVNYYTALTNLLNRDSINILELELDHTFDLIKVFKETFILPLNKTPEVIIANIYDDDSRILKTKKKSFTINNIHYELDSVVIRDTTEQHFCSLITCNNKEYAFEGSSFKRISPFKWKHLLNKNSTFSFNGLASQLNMVWNFRKGYQQLFYYRKN